jgi:hypothetical protein
MAPVRGSISVTMKGADAARAVRPRRDCAGSALGRSSRSRGPLQRGQCSPHRAARAADRMGAAWGDYCSQRSVDGAAMLPPSSSQMLTARRWRFLSTPRRFDWPSMGRRLGGPTKRELVHGFGLQGPQNRCRGCASSFPVMIRRTGALPSVQYIHMAAVSDLGRSSVRALTNLAPRFAVVYDCAHRPCPPGPVAAAACRQLMILVRTTSLRRCRQGTSNA